MFYSLTQTYDKRAGVFVSILVILSLVLATVPSVFAEDDEDVTFDGLKRVEDSTVATAFINPDADFSVFDSVMILDPYVAFRSNWRRDQNRSRRSNRINQRDMDRIKADTAALFKEVFLERLQADGGLVLVKEAGANTLLLRPAIIDLDITAPDTRSAGRSSTFAGTAGAATLFIELFDAGSGQIIGRAIDRQATRNAGGRVSWSNSVTNRAEGRRMFGNWADTLRGFLDQHYLKATD
jgi:hypothetical protein